MTVADNVQPIRPEVKTEVLRGSKESDDPLLNGLLLLCKLHHRPATAAELTAGLPLENGRLTLPLMGRAAARADLDVQVSEKEIASLIRAYLPALLILKDGTTAVSSLLKRGK